MLERGHLSLYINVLSNFSIMWACEAFSTVNTLWISTRLHNYRFIRRFSWCQVQSVVKSFQHICMVWNKIGMAIKLTSTSILQQGQTYIIIIIALRSWCQIVLGWSVLPIVSEVGRQEKRNKLEIPLTFRLTKQHGYPKN